MGLCVENIKSEKHISRDLSSYLYVCKCWAIYNKTSEFDYVHDDWAILMRTPKALYSDIDPSSIN